MYVYRICYSYFETNSYLLQEPEDRGRRGCDDEHWKDEPRAEDEHVVAQVGGVFPRGGAAGRNKIFHFHSPEK